MNFVHLLIHLCHLHNRLNHTSFPLPHLTTNHPLYRQPTTTTHHTTNHHHLIIPSTNHHHPSYHQPSPTVKSTPKRPNKLVDFSNLPKPLISSSNTTIDVASPGSLFWKSTDVSSSTSHSPLVPQAPPSNLFPHSITTETSPKADQNLFERWVA